MSDLTNEIDTEKTARIVSEVDKCDDELVDLRMEYAAKAKAPKQRRSDWIQMGIDGGLPREAFKLYLKEHAFDRKMERLRADVEEDTLELADMIRAKLGDFAGLPLGDAAVRAAEIEQPKKRGRGRPRKNPEASAGSETTSKSDALDSLVSDDTPEDDVRPRFLQDSADLEAANENAARLEGISELKH